MGDIGDANLVVNNPYPVVPFWVIGNEAGWFPKAQVSYIGGWLV